MLKRLVTRYFKHQTQYICAKKGRWGVVKGAVIAAAVANILILVLILILIIRLKEVKKLES